MHFEPLLTTLIWLTLGFLVWRKKNQRFGGFLVAEILGFGLFWIFLLVPMTLLFFGDLDLGLPGFDLDWLAQIILGFFSHFWRLCPVLSGPLVPPWSVLLWASTLPFSCKRVPLGQLGIGQAALCLRYLLISSATCGVLRWVVWDYKIPDTVW